MWELLFVVSFAIFSLMLVGGAIDNAEKSEKDQKNKQMQEIIERLEKIEF